MKNFAPILLLAKLLTLVCLSSGCIDSPARAEPSKAAIRAYEAEFVALQSSVDRIEAAFMPPVVDLSPLAAVDVEHGAMLQSIDAKLDSLLEESLPSQQLAEAPTTTETSTAAPEVSTPPSPSARLVTVRGKRVDVDVFVRQHYRGRWSHPGTIDKHLVEHGVKADELVGLDSQTKEMLHSAIHESERGRSVAKSRTVTRAPVVVPRVSPCPGGVCPSPVVQRYGLSGRSYTRSRRR